MNPEPAGLSVPFRIGADGRVAVSRGRTKIEENLVHVLLTRAGERPMRRDLGTGLYDLLQDPLDDALAALVREHLAVAGQWAGTVSVVAVDVELGDAVLVIRLGYQLRGSVERHELVVTL